MKVWNFFKKKEPEPEPEQIMYSLPKQEYFIEEHTMGDKSIGYVLRYRYGVFDTNAVGFDTFKSKIEAIESCDRMNLSILKNTSVSKKRIYP